MDGKTPHLLPPSEAKKEIRDDVPLVCAWALINAFSIVSGAASGYIAAYFRIACIQSSFILPCIQLTDAEEARLIALFVGMLCCAASQAAAAALALSRATVAGPAVPLPTSRSRSPSSSIACTPAPSRSSTPPTQDTSWAGSTTP
uniref:Uncharacterized protein n=1 Tax=Triticum urartu TaxID=4572 RepID=A0A8R7REC8_TRIUA